jgi:hypothetical protein
VSAVYKLSSKPFIEGGLTVTADSKEHAIELALYQLRPLMDPNRWPVNGQPIYIRRVA